MHACPPHQTWVYASRYGEELGIGIQAELDHFPSKVWVGVRGCSWIMWVRVRVRVRRSLRVQG